jgi:hypothetical protein
MDMTPAAERYALKIYSIMNKITEVETLIERRKLIKGYSKSDPEKIIIDTILKLQNAKIELHNAVDCLLAPTHEKETHKGIES